MCRACWRVRDWESWVAPVSSSWCGSAGSVGVLGAGGVVELAGLSSRGDQQSQRWASSTRAKQSVGTSPLELPLAMSGRRPDAASDPYVP
jgi:hypothetical protein